MNKLKSDLSRPLISVVCAVLFLSTANVMAHPDASDPQFCAHGTVEEVGSVSLTGTALASILRNNPVDCSVGVKEVKDDRNPINKELRHHIGGVLVYRNIYKRHDFFEFTPARMAYAYASCVCASMINEDIDPASARPLLESPEILLDENHHEDYQFTDGLRFSCQVCK